MQGRATIVASFLVAMWLANGVVIATTDVQNELIPFTAYHMFAGGGPHHFQDFSGELIADEGATLVGLGEVFVGIGTYDQFHGALEQFDRRIVDEECSGDITCHGLEVFCSDDLSSTVWGWVERAASERGKEGYTGIRILVERTDTLTLDSATVTLVDSSWGGCP